jgi:hypothetical protein
MTEPLSSAESSDEDLVSAPIKKITARKASNPKVSSHTSDQDYSTPTIDETYPGLFKIKFEIKIGDTDYVAKGSCSAFATLQEARKAFAVACRLYEEEDFEAEPDKPLPLFACRTADAPAKKKELLNDDSNWDELLETLKQREEERWKAEKAGRKMVPKSFLPLLVEIVPENNSKGVCS